MLHGAGTRESLQRRRALRTPELENAERLLCSACAPPRGPQTQSVLLLHMPAYPLHAGWGLGSVHSPRQTAQESGTGAHVPMRLKVVEGGGLFRLAQLLRT
jgi:hypothetical protein